MSNVIETFVTDMQDLAQKDVTIAGKRIPGVVVIGGAVAGAVGLWFITRKPGTSSKKSGSAVSNEAEGLFDSGIFDKLAGNVSESYGDSLFGGEPNLGGNVTESQGSFFDNVTSQANDILGSLGSYIPFSAPEPSPVPADYYGYGTEALPLNNYAAGYTNTPVYDQPAQLPETVIDVLQSTKPTPPPKVVGSALANLKKLTEPVPNIRDAFNTGFNPAGGKPPTPTKVGGVLAPPSKKPVENVITGGFGKTGKPAPMGKTGGFMDGVKTSLGIGIAKPTNNVITGGSDKTGKPIPKPVLTTKPATLPKPVTPILKPAATPRPVTPVSLPGMRPVTTKPVNLLKPTPLAKPPAPKPLPAVKVGAKKKPLAN